MVKNITDNDIPTGLGSVMNVKRGIPNKPNIKRGTANIFLKYSTIFDLTRIFTKHSVVRINISIIIGINKNKGLIPLMVR